MPNKYSFAEITKVYVEGEKRFVEGYASTGAVDADDEIVDPEATREAGAEWAKWGNVRYMHLPHAVGVVEDMRFDDKGLFVKAEIVDDDIWEKVKKGVLKGFSIGFSKAEKVWDKVKEAWRIVKYQLVEISLVDNPANPECSFTIVKRAEDADHAAEAAQKEAEEMAEQDAARAAEEKTSVLATVRGWFKSGAPEAEEVKALLPEDKPEPVKEPESLEVKALRADITKLAEEQKALKVELAMSKASTEAASLCKRAHLPPKFEYPLAQYKAGAEEIKLDEAGEHKISRNEFFDRLLEAKGTAKLDDPKTLGEPPAKVHVEAAVLGNDAEQAKLQALAAKADALSKADGIPVNEAMKNVLAAEAKGGE